MALSHGALKLIWVKSLLSELEYKIDATLFIWCDSMSIIALAENLVFYCRTKHIEIDVHFIRDMIRKRVFALKYIPSRREVAYTMTIALLGEAFEFHKNMFRIWTDY